MKLLNKDVKRIGMGCWAIGGPFAAGSESWAYADTNDEQSARTLHAALDAGVQVFDTAPAYGAGHSERLLGEALKGKENVFVVTKLGVGIEEKTRQVTGEDTHPDNVSVAIESSLARMQREHIDVVLLHLNSLAVDKADKLFDQMEQAVTAGKVGAIGWSTDYPASVQHMAGRESCQFIEHGMNILMDVPTIQATARQNKLTAFIRSPLAMGVLTGKYGPGSVMSKDDIRSTGAQWMEYFNNGKPSQDYLASLDALRELLKSDGRTLVQGVLGWLLAKAEFNIPVPGARTPDQVIENAGAIEYGPLSANVMEEIEALITRPPEGEPRDR
ncbi:MAG: aldo/keto reductase [Granulosicoccus sp.]